MPIIPPQPKKKSSVLVQSGQQKQSKKNKRRIVIAWSILIALIVLFSATFPVKSIPFARSIFGLMGIDVMAEEGLTLAGILMGRAGAAARARTFGGEGSEFAGADGYYYGGRRGTETSWGERFFGGLGAINADTNTARLYNNRAVSRELLKDGKRPQDVGGVAFNPEDRQLYSEVVLTGNEQYRQYAEDPFMPFTETPTPGAGSTFNKPGGIDRIAASTRMDYSSYTASAVQSSIDMRLDKTIGGLETTRSNVRNYSGRGGPYSEAGVAMLYSSAATRAKLPETKKRLADAAFDGSNVEATVISDEKEATGIHSEATASKMNNLNAEQKRANECRLMMQKINSPLANAKTKAASIFQSMQQSGVPSCRTGCPWPLGGNSSKSAADSWNNRINDLTGLCTEIQGYHEQIKQVCRQNTREGTGTCTFGNLGSARIGGCSSWEAIAVCAGGSARPFTYGEFEAENDSFLPELDTDYSTPAPPPEGEGGEGAVTEDE
ncbi:hypothetical protein Dip518_001550 [Parelusimicrobium proximum]|uniref:hypothetical protein n=1 Tax=Parelusimicrobium proximum TaxID=3228953 RepID=UPI003D183FE6